MPSLSQNKLRHYLIAQTEAVPLIGAAAQVDAVWNYHPAANPDIRMHVKSYFSVMKTRLEKIHEYVDFTEDKITLFA